MDVFAHGLWGGAAYMALNQKVKKPLNIRWAVLFSVFPDVFAFVPAFIWMVWNLVFGTLSVGDLPRPENVEPAQRDTLPIFRLTSTLYHFSHSLIFFGIVFFVVYLIFRRPVWELGAWLLHILIDIPTHSYQFYPTPFLWPLSDTMFNGISWGVPWFMMLNYSSLLLVYLLLMRNKKQKQAL